MADQFVLVPVPDPMIGMVIDHFVIISLLGRGGMGAVYLAQHEGSPYIRCVIKTMLAHLANNAMMISRFKIETEAVSRLKHDNIVKLENFGVLPDGKMFMRFEYIEGIPLDRYLGEQGGRLSLHRAIYLVFQVCDALDHAHAAGVVHRDLKPDNLLIEVDLAARVPQLVKIVDFGISKIARTDEVQTGSGVAMGTPYFMAVEQYANAAEASPKSDVFSLAIILWLMLTGELPWGKPDPSVLYFLQRTVIPTPPPEDAMPAAVAKLLLRCLSVDPDDRPDMREFAIELASIVAATDRAPSGAEILADLVPRWMVSAPEDVRTARHPSVRSDRVAAQLWPQIRTPPSPRDGVAGRPPPTGAAQPVAAVLPASVEVAARSPDEDPLPAPAPPPPLSSVTVRERPGALAAPPSPAARSELASPDAPTPAFTSAASPEGRRLPTPVIAALPTGLASQKYAAQAPPMADGVSPARIPSIVAAAEIELATGTPGPKPYAHAELPPVLVSATQVSGVTPQPSSAIPGSPRHPEPAPFLVLPRAARTRSARKLLAIGAALLIAAAAASFALVRTSRVVAHRAAQGTAAGSEAGAVPTRESAAGSGAAAAPGGPAASDNVTATQPGLSSSAAQSSPPTLATNQHNAGAPTVPAASAVVPVAGGRANAAPTSRPDSTADASSTPAKRAASAAPESVRVAASRTTSPQRTLRERQQEAHATGAKTGNLRLLVTPWAVCWVDGERVDQTPCILDGLPVGRYRVRLENRVAHKDEALTVTVAAGETTTIERTW